MTVTSPRAMLPHAFTMEARKERGSISLEIIHQIRREASEFHEPRSANPGLGLQLAVETALQEFPEVLENAGEPSIERLRVYRALGRCELAHGHSLDALHAACRLGGRVALRRYARIGQRAGLRPDEMVALADAIFGHIDALVSAAAAGYAEAKDNRDSIAGVSTNRRLLRDLLVARAETSPDQLEQAAAAAGVRLAERLACVALGMPPPSGTSTLRIGGLPQTVLYGLDRQNPFMVLCDPASDLRDGLLVALLRECGAVVGPTVPPSMAHDSLRWARRVHERLSAAQPLAKAPVVCDHALPSVLLLADEPLVTLLVGRRLAPLADLTAKQRRRMEATLLAWLNTNGGSAPQIAAKLGIHPQTARQRLHRLHELVGPVFVDPDARFELEVALRGQRAVETLSRQQ